MEEILWFALGAASMLAFIATMVLVEESRNKRHHSDLR